MDLFTVIEDGCAILRLPKGVHKQVKVYHRAGRVYVPAGGGYVRVTAFFHPSYGTSNPDIKVLELEGEGIDVAKGEPRFVAALRVAA